MIRNSQYRMYAVTAALLLVVVLLPWTVSAEQSSARSVAMGEAYTALANGVDAARYNPANLGLDGYRRTELEVFGLGADINNNSFSLSDYNRYTGAYLTDADKADILAKVPEQGLLLSADVQASAVSLSSGSFALTTSAVGLANVNLNRDLLELVLNGNTFGDTISVTGSYSDAVAYVSTGVSYGMALYTAGTRQLSVGATAKYIRGLAVEKIVELDGLAATFETGFEGEGRMIAQTATGGSGYALDLGAALKLSDSYTAGIRVKNFLSSLKWDKQTEEHSYIFSFDTVTIANADGDFVVSESDTKPIASFSTDLPSLMTVGFAKTSGSLLWAVDWEQGFRTAAGASTKPRLSLGLEWSGLPFLPVRAGYSTGAERPAAFSFGSGVAFGPFYLDGAVVTGKSLSPYSTKGINLAVSSGLYF